MPKLHDTAHHRALLCLADMRDRGAWPSFVRYRTSYRASVSCKLRQGGADGGRHGRDSTQANARNASNKRWQMVITHHRNANTDNSNNSSTGSISTEKNNTNPDSNNANTRTSTPTPSPTPPSTSTPTPPPTPTPTKIPPTPTTQQLHPHQAGTQAGLTVSTNLSMSSSYRPPSATVIDLRSLSLPFPCGIP